MKGGVYSPFIPSFPSHLNTRRKGNQSSSVIVVSRFGRFGSSLVPYVPFGFTRRGKVDVGGR